MHRLTRPFLLTLTLTLTLALSLLAACAPTPTRVEGFRTKGPIYSNAVLDLARIEGRWSQVAAFSSKASACPPGGAEITRQGGGLFVAARLCLNGADLSYGGPLAISGPGRVTPAAKAPRPLDREWWVLWADVDLRTLVIGTPDGSFGFILNRGGDLPADRLTAARDILDWNGYDTARLQVLRP